MKTGKWKIEVFALAIMIAVSNVPSFCFSKEPDESSTTKKITNLILKTVLRIKPRFDDSSYQMTAVIGVRGFSTAQPYEKSAFRFGALSAELQYAESVPDAERAKKAAELIVMGLEQANMKSQLSGQSGTFSELYPVMEEFVSARKLDDYFQMGQWVASMRLAMLTGGDENMDMVSPFLGSENQAGHFLAVLKDKEVPPGVINNLQKLNRMKKKTVLTEKDLKDAADYLRNILLLMG